MLGPPGALDCLMLSTPTRKTPKTPKTLLLFATMYLIVQTCEVVCIYPHLPYWSCILQAALVVYNVAMLTIAVSMDPGYISPTSPNGYKVDFLQLLEVSDSTQLCPDCLTVRTSRSRHCSVCQKCVERFDHHCPWINNCVGCRNHNYFFQFVFTMFLVLALSLIHAFYALVIVLSNGYKQTTCWPFWPQIPPGVFFGCLAIQLLITGPFFIALMWLTCIHSKNFCSNKTTIERLSRH